MTEFCPICLNPAEPSRGRDYGDKEEVSYPRCGPFEISRTVLAMLDSRIDQDELIRARLSHAIRVKTSAGNQLSIDSRNLDELAQLPLPNIEESVKHLARWLAAELGDDRLGRVPYPSPGALAAVVGVADGDRVRRLISYAAKQGIVEHEPGIPALRLSPEGWEMVEPGGSQEDTNQTTRRKLDTAVEHDEALPITPVMGESSGEGLNADPSDRTHLSDPDAVAVTQVKDQHAASLQKLVELRLKLNEFHGSDIEYTQGIRNTEEVPFSEDELQLLRAVVDSAIALHQAPTIPKRVIEALRNMYEFLIDTRVRVEELSKTVGALEGLALKIGGAVLALKELLDILGITGGNS